MVNDLRMLQLFAQEGEGVAENICPQETPTEGGGCSVEATCHPERSAAESKDPRSYGTPRGTDSSTPPSGSLRMTGGDESPDLAQNDSGEQDEVGAADPLRRHYDGLLRQAEALREQFPDFNLSRELENPLFLRLTAPGVGVSLEDAFYTVHRRQLQQAAVEVTAQRTAQSITNAIRSGAQRPLENGTGSHAPAVTAFDYRNATRQQREALKKAIRAAGARGEKLYPGF